jgi:hypothetical protein
MARRLSGSVLSLTLFIATPAPAQDSRTVVFGEVGRATIGYADSQQGRAPIFGGGAAFQLAPWLVIEGDVHRGRVEHVFGHRHHEFSELTTTGSLLVRVPSAGRIHFVTGAGLAMQRAHTVVNEPPFGRIDEIEWLNLLHSSIGADWDVSRRLMIRTDAVVWIGEGLDWVAGGRVGLGYRF